MKRTLPASKISLLSVILLLFAAYLAPKKLSAQVDTEFWFAVPYVNVHHGINYVQNVGDFYGGAFPLYFKISTLGEQADVEISMPASGEILFSEIIPANQTRTYPIPLEKRFDIMASKHGNEVEDKGILITSSFLRITVYYENATHQNPDLFSLKGRNALGSLFFTPFQTRWPNDPRHNENFTSPLDQYWPHVNGNASDVPATYSNLDPDRNTDGRVKLSMIILIQGTYSKSIQLFLHSIL
jgi:hypothetical protein